MAKYAAIKSLSIDVLMHFDGSLRPPPHPRFLYAFEWEMVKTVAPTKCISIFLNGP